MRIKLAVLDKSDFPQIVKWVNQHSADFIVQWAGLTYTYPLTVEQMNEHYRRGINSFDSDVFIYKIMVDENFVGTVQLCRFNMECKEAVIARFLIGEETNRGKGIGKQALNELVRIGFDEFGLQAIKLNVFDFNKQAIRCYESIGFRQSLYRRNVYQDKTGVWWNNMEMTLIKDNWPGSLDGMRA